MDSEVVEQICRYILSSDFDYLFNYIKNNNINSTIAKEYISERGLTYKINNVLDSLIESYDSLEKIKILLDLSKDSPSYTNIYTAIKKNYFDLADILLEHSEIKQYSIINDLYERNYLNFYNLKYILLNSSYKDLLSSKSESDFNIDIIYQWIESFKNTFLEIYLKYINNENNILEIKNEYYSKTIENENYDGFIILFDSDNKNISDTISFLLSLFERDENGYPAGEKYNRFMNYINDVAKPFKERNFYCNGRYDTEDKYKYKFIDENKYNSLRLNIKKHIETYLKTIHDMADFLKSNVKMGKKTFEKYLKDKNIELKSLNNFDILTFAIENDVSKDIIKYIINEFSYENLNYGYEKTILNNDNNEICYTINEIRERNFQNKKMNINNLEYHFKNGKTKKRNSNEHLISHIDSEISFIKTPLFTAISKNKFEIADMLIEKGANFNFKNENGNNDENIIYALYSSSLLNSENLKYILLHADYESNIINNDALIYNWIKSFSNDFLEIYLKYLNDEKEKIKEKDLNIDNFYQLSIYYENYHGIFILYDHDTKIENENKKTNIDDDDEGEEEDDALYRIYMLFLKKYEKEYSNFMNEINDKTEKSQHETKKVNDKVNKKDKIQKLYIYQDKYLQIKNKMKKTFSKFDIISKRNKSDIRKQVTKLIEENKLDKLKNYINNNFVILNELSYNKYNYYNNDDYDNDNISFDILIFSIQNNASLEILKYIISLYKDLNYSLSYINNQWNELPRNRWLLNVNDNDNNDDSFKFQFNWNVPLYTAIANNKFQISDLLIEHGADINYQKNIIYFLYNENHLNIENLKYILNHGFLIEYMECKDIENIGNSRIKTEREKSKDYLINKWINNDENEFLEIYLKYNNNPKDKKIKQKYYKNAIRQEKYNALIILFDNDERDKKEIVYEIVKILFWVDNNELNINEDDKDDENDENDNNIIDYIKRLRIKNIKNAYHNLCNEIRKPKIIDSTYKDGIKYKEIINKIKNKELKFNNEKFYNFKSNIDEKHKYSFIDKKKFLKIISEIKDIILEIEESLEKRFKISEHLENDNILKFEQYIIEEKIQLKHINTFNFDLLIYAIENDIEDDLIKYIIDLQLDEKKMQSNNEIETKMDNIFNYCCEGQKNEFGLMICKTPIFCAIENDKIQIADLLLKHGCDINYSIHSMEKNNNEKYGILEYLYYNKYFDKDTSVYGLMYLLNNGYIIKNNKIIDTLIDYFIKNGKKYELEILLKFPTEQFQKIPIKEKYYTIIIEKKNTELLYILYDNDNNDKYKVLGNIYKIYECFQNSNFVHSFSSSLIDFVERRNPPSSTNTILYYYYNHNKDNKTITLNKYNFINKRKFNQITTEIKEFMKNVTDVKENVISNFKIIKYDVTKFKSFISDNKIDLTKINSYKFDILIYAIENDASWEVKKYIVDQYQGEKALNYYIERNNRYEDRSNKQYVTPLLAALEKNNLKLAELILSKPGTDINYEPENMNPTFIYQKNFLNDKKLKFIINKGYRLVKNLIMYCIYDIYCESKEKYLRIIYNHFYFDNHFTINLLNAYKYKAIISTETLEQLILTERKKVINDDTYDFLIEYGNKKTIKQVLKYELNNEKRTLILKRYTRRIPGRFEHIYGESDYYRNGRIIEDPFKKNKKGSDNNSQIINNRNNNYANPFNVFNLNNNYDNDDNDDYNYYYDDDEGYPVGSDPEEWT